jgi:hypothetical protein
MPPFGFWTYEFSAANLIYLTLTLTWHVAVVWLLWKILLELRRTR